jgi:hypothetical protein
MALHRRDNYLYEEDEPLQEQLPLEDCEVQEEMELSEMNPDLLDRLKSLNEKQCGVLDDLI